LNQYNYGLDESMLTCFVMF